MKSQKIIVMGVSGCGKSAIGQGLAALLQLPFFDGDDYHSPENISKMQHRTALDRQGWLEELSVLLASKQEGVLACSALTSDYRRVLKHNNPTLLFVYLQGDFDTIWQRHSKRENHYFNGKTMLESQFETLQEPSKTEALIVDIRLPVRRLIADIYEKLPAFSHSTLVNEAS